MNQSTNIFLLLYLIIYFSFGHYDVEAKSFLDLFLKYSYFYNNDFVVHIALNLVNQISSEELLQGAFLETGYFGDLYEGTILLKKHMLMPREKVAEFLKSPNIVLRLLDLLLTDPSRNIQHTIRYLVLGRDLRPSQIYEFIIQNDHVLFNNALFDEKEKAAIEFLAIMLFLMILNCFHIVTFNASWLV